MYVNGEFIQEADHDADFVYDGRILGRTPQGTPAHSYFNELSIFKSKDLTETEILNIYNAGGRANLNSLGPDHWLRFNNNYSNSGTSNATHIISGISFIEYTNTNIVANSPIPAYITQTDGDDDRLTAVDTEAFSSGDFTISMWVKLEYHKS